MSAPGVNVIAPYPGGYYAIVSGTSFAAPMVSVEAALVLAKKMMDADNVQDKIKDTSVDIDYLNPTYKGMLGAGRIDYFRW